MLKTAEKYLQLINGEYYKCFGKVAKVVGLTIESVGPEARLNDLCKIFLDNDRSDFVTEIGRASCRERVCHRV